MAIGQFNVRDGITNGNGTSAASFTMLSVSGQRPAVAFKLLVAKIRLSSVKTKSVET